MNEVVLSADGILKRFFITTKEFFRHIVRIYVVAINFIIIARDVTVLPAVYCCSLFSNGACLDLVRKLTSLDLASSSVAEVGAFPNMAFLAIRSFLAISVDCKWSTNRSARRNVSMRVPAVCVGAMSPLEVYPHWCSLWSKLMRDVTSFHENAITPHQVIRADGYLGWVVHVSAIRSLAAHTCKHRCQ